MRITDIFFIIAFFLSMSPVLAEDQNLFLKKQESDKQQHEIFVQSPQLKSPASEASPTKTDLFHGISINTHSVEVQIYETVFSYETPVVSSEYYLPAPTHVIQAKTYYGPIPLKDKTEVTEVPDAALDKKIDDVVKIKSVDEHKNEEMTGKADKYGGTETRLIEKAAKQTETESHSIIVYFAFDSSALSDEETKKLNELKVKEIELVKGSASPEGSSCHNIELSKERAAAVKEFLEKSGIKVNKTEWKGDGECKASESTWPECRKVELSY